MYKVIVSHGGKVVFESDRLNECFKFIATLGEKKAGHKIILMTTDDQNNDIQKELFVYV